MTIITGNQSQGDFQVVTIKGDINAVSVPLLREEIQAAMKQQDSRNLAIDLAEVDFVDSSGISMLVSFHKTLHDKGHRLVLVKLPEMLRGALEVTHLIAMFEIVDSIEEL